MARGSSAAAAAGAAGAAAALVRASKQQSPSPASSSSSSSSCAPRGRGRRHARGSPVVVVVLAAAVTMTLLQGWLFGRSTATATARGPLRRQLLGWIIVPSAPRRPRLQQLSALLDLAFAVGSRRREGRVAPLAAEAGGSSSSSRRSRSTSRKSSAGSKSCQVGNVGVESPYKGKPPAYRHLVFPGNDTAAEAAAFHRDWEEGARFQLTVRVAPSKAAPSASIAASNPSAHGGAAALLMAEGELVKLPTAAEGEEGEGDTMRRRTVWRTRAWVGDGEGEGEATWELIAQGMAAAQSLGAKRLALDVTSQRLAHDILAPQPPPEEAHAVAATPRLVSLREKVLAARKKHFPDAALSVVVSGGGREDEERQAESGLGARIEALQTAAAPKVSAVAARGKKGGAAVVAVLKAAAAADVGDGVGSPTASGSGGSKAAGTKKPKAAPAPPALEGKYLLRFDGGSRGNPGPSGAGVVLYRFGDGRTEALLKEVTTDALWLGESGTNNEAEYKGLIAGLKLAREMGVKELEVEGDSQLVVRQMLGEYKVKTERLKPLHAEAQKLARGFHSFQIRHIERAENARADELANEALDAWYRDGF